MKNKIIVEGAVIVLLFLAAWFSLSQIDWMKHLKIQELNDKTEKKLGELFWKAFKESEDENTDSEATAAIDSIVTHICKANKIDRDHLKIHILNKDEVNAFALPDGHLVLYTGLIANTENQEELTGVICHELAHIQLNHVMKKLVKEVGLSVLISMTTGNTGGEVIKSAGKLLSSTAFDRNLEKEADIKAVDYLLKAQVDPEPFAEFLYRLSENESEMQSYLTWVSTHPDSEKRAEYIIEHSKDKKTDYQSILTDKTWVALKNSVSSKFEISTQEY